MKRGVFLIATILAPAIAHAELAAETDILSEVNDAHQRHFLAPTCADISQAGSATLKDPTGAEAFAHKAIQLRVLSREKFYFGIIGLARTGWTQADFERLEMKCWKQLPKAELISPTASMNG